MKAQCKNCGQWLELPGRAATCPNCGQLVTIPVASRENQKKRDDGGIFTADGNITYEQPAPYVPPADYSMPAWVRSLIMIGVGGFVNRFC